MNRKEFYEQVTLEPVTNAVNVLVLPTPPINPQPCIHQYDFYTRIKIIDGKIVVKVI